MSVNALTHVVDDRIWTLDRPVWFGGARLRARTTVVRLDDGSLLLHTPGPIADALAEQLRALGPVRWLVVPNCWHHLGTPAAAARFPEADIVCRADAKDHWSWRYAARITGCYERVRVPPDARKKISDKAAAARSIRTMLERPAQRLIVGHGDINEEGFRESLAQAWRLEGVEV